MWDKLETCAAVFFAASLGGLCFVSSVAVYRSLVGGAP